MESAITGRGLQLHRRREITGGEGQITPRLFDSVSMNHVILYLPKTIITEIIIIKEVKPFGLTIPPQEPIPRYQTQETSFLRVGQGSPSGHKNKIDYL